MILVVFLPDILCPSFSARSPPPNFCFNYTLDSGVEKFSPIIGVDDVDENVQSFEELG